MSVEFPSLIELPMPILTPRLLIRPPQPGDGPAFHAVINASKEHLKRFLPWAEWHRSVEESENTARLQYTKFLNRTDIVLGIFDKDTQTLLGGSGLHRIDWNIPKFEIGYWVSKDAEGRGIVSEAVNAITRYAFKQLQAKRLEIRYETDNLRSRALAERLGFHLDGCLRRDRFKSDGQELTDTWIHSRIDPAGLPELSVSW